MFKLIVILFGILTVKNTSAQLQADFHCNGSSYDLSCGGFTDISNPGSGTIINWRWYFGNGMVSDLQNPQGICYDSIGTYTVCLIVYDANGNSSIKCKHDYMERDSLRVHCNYFVGVVDADRGVEFSHLLINNEFTIETNNFDKTELYLFDLSARKIFSREFVHTLTFNTSDLLPGIYLYQLKTKSGLVYNNKFIKE